MGRLQNNYSGHVLKAESSVEFVPAQSKDAGTFFAEYVKNRKPVVLRSGNADFLSTEFSNASLAGIVGDQIVEVEVKDGNGFGNTNVGERKKVRFTSDFLRTLRDGSTYLTTQQIEEDESGNPKFFAPAVVRSLIDAGIVPGFLPLAGNLTLDQINVWMGFSANGPTSSGFHHDFHDNFYFVIRGKKTFKLMSPDSLGTRVPTFGSQARKHTVVNSNGLVSYSGNDIREDGAPLDDVLAWKAKVDPEQYMEAYEERVLMSALKNEPKLQQPAHFATERAAPKDAVVLDLVPGDILYLPAGFFHEVLSENDETNTGHLVFNYWYHPPVSTGTFTKPYSDSFWARFAEGVAERAEAAELRPSSGAIRRKRPIYKPRPLFKYYSKSELRRALLKQLVTRDA